MAFNAFLKIDGIPGEGAGGTISIESFSWGVTGSQGSATGAGAGRPVYSDLTIVKLVDATSPTLLQSAITGKLLPAVQLTCRKLGEQEFAFYKLTDVEVASFRDGGNRHGGDFPTEEVAFSFQKIEINISRAVG